MKKIVCSQCGHLNSPSVAVCAECGRVLTPGMDLHAGDPRRIHSSGIREIRKKVTELPYGATIEIPRYRSRAFLAVFALITALILIPALIEFSVRLPIMATMLIILTPPLIQGLTTSWFTVFKFRKDRFEIRIGLLKYTIMYQWIRKIERVEQFPNHIARISFMNGTGSLSLDFKSNRRLNAFEKLLYNKSKISLQFPAHSETVRISY